MKRLGLLEKSVATIAGSRLFDGQWYKAHFNIDWTTHDPVVHFLQTWQEHFISPSASFDICKYIAANSDISFDGLNPLFHYLEIGQFQYRQIFAVDDAWDADKILSDLHSTDSNFGRCRVQHGRLALFVCHVRNYRLDDNDVVLLEELRTIADTIILSADCYLPWYEILKVRHLLCAYDCRKRPDEYSTLAAALCLASRGNLFAKYEQTVIATNSAYPLDSLKPGLLNTLPCLQGSLNNSTAPLPVLLFVPSADLKQATKGNCAQASVKRFIEDIIDRATSIAGGPNFKINPSWYLDFAVQVVNAPDLPVVTLVEQALTSCGLSPFEAKISVLLPTAAPIEQIMEALGSVVSQNYPHFEILLLVRRDSGYLRAEIEAAYPSECERGMIRFITPKQIDSLADAIKAGAAAASGAYIFMLMPEFRLRPDTLHLLTLARLALPEKDILHAPSGITLDSLEARPLSEQLVQGCHYDSVAGLFWHEGINFDLALAELDQSWTASFRFLRVMEKMHKVGRLANIWLEPNRPHIPLPKYSPPNHKGKKVVQTLILGYNCDNCLEEAVESVLMQEGDFEHKLTICNVNLSVNDKAIAQEYVRKFSQIEFFDARGYASPLFIKKLCDADFLCPLYGHDYWIDPAKIASQLEYMELHPQLRACFSASHVLDEYSLQTFPVHSSTYLSQIITIHHMLKLEDPAPFFSCCLYDGALMKIAPDFLFSLWPPDYLLCLFFANYGQIGYLPRKQAVQRKTNRSLWFRFTKLDYLVRSAAMRRQADWLTPFEQRETLNQVIRDYDWQLNNYLQEESDNV